MYLRFLARRFRPRSHLLILQVFYIDRFPQIRNKLQLFFCKIASPEIAPPRLGGLCAPLAKIQEFRQGYAGIAVGGRNSVPAFDPNSLKSFGGLVLVLR